MTARQQTVSIVSVAALLIGASCMFAWRNGQVATDPESLLSRLPTQNAVVAGLDFDALRASGILNAVLSSKGVQETEYLEFVRASGFDYQRDLHSVLASFAPDGEFFLIRGRFDWEKLEQYTRQQHGLCANHFCHMDGSTPEKKISFLPLRRDLMAMAVAPEDTAALRLKKLGPQDDVPVQNAPVWLTFSAGALRNSASRMPLASRVFASAIMDAERVTVTIGPTDQNLPEARLEAVCRDAQQAGALSGQLQTLTGLLSRAAANQGDARAPDDFAGVLASGKFWNAGSHVLGRWVIPGSVLQNLAR